MKPYTIKMFTQAELSYINAQPKTDLIKQIGWAVALQLWKYSIEAWNKIVDELRVEMAQKLSEEGTK